MAPVGGGTNEAQVPIDVYRPLADWACAQEKRLWKEAKSWDADAPTDVRCLRVSQSIPIVDLADFLAGSPGGAEEASAHLRVACAEVGFYHVTGFESIVPSEMLATTFEAMDRYFALPEEVKLEVEIGEARPTTVQPRGTGYTRVGAKMMPAREKGNLIESFIISNHARALYRTEVALHSAGTEPNQLPFAADAPLPWPQSLGPSWQALIEAYIDRMELLARKLMVLIALALGMEASYFDQALVMPGPLWRLRLCSYPADPQSVADGSYGMPPHVDTSLLTIVASTDEDDEPGLALHCDNLGGWVRAPGRPGTLLVNSGDVLQSITNDVWPAARHYVGNPSERGCRRSLAYFLNAAPAAKMEVAPTFITAERPAHYHPTSWMEGRGVHRGGFFRQVRPDVHARPQEAKKGGCSATQTCSLS